MKNLTVLLFIAMTSCSKQHVEIDQMPAKNATATVKTRPGMENVWRPQQCVMPNEAHTIGLLCSATGTTCWNYIPICIDSWLGRKINMKELMDSLKIGLNADSVSKDNIDITNCELLKILNKKGLPVIPCEE